MITKKQKLIGAGFAAVAFAGIAGIGYFTGGETTVNDNQPEPEKIERIQRPHLLLQKRGDLPLSHGEYRDNIRCEAAKVELVNKQVWITAAAEKYPEDELNPVRLAVHAENLKKENDGQADPDLRRRVASTFTCQSL